MFPTLPVLVVTIQGLKVLWYVRVRIPQPQCMLGTDVLEPHILPYNQILHEQVIATPEGASAKSEEGIRLV